MKSLQKSIIPESFFTSDSFEICKNLFHSSVSIDSSRHFTFSSKTKQLGRHPCDGWILMEFIKKCIHVFSSTKGFFLIEKSSIIVSPDSIGFIPTGIEWHEGYDGLLPLHVFQDLIKFIQARQIDMKLTDVSQTVKLKEYANCETWEQLVYFSKEFSFSRIIFYYTRNVGLAPPKLKDQIDCELIRIKSSHSF